MKDAVRVHATDATDADVRARHVSIENRLIELGEDRVRMMLFHGGLPTEWNTIVHSWLSGDRLERTEDEKVKPKEQDAT